MLSTSQAILLSWTFPPILTALNLLAVLLYLRGWLSVRTLHPERFSKSRATCFFAGIATLQIALASPIDAFDGFFLTDHMIQHLLLMMLAPPLILLGNPGVPIMRGLPRTMRRALGRMLKHAPFSWLADLVAKPMLCWLLFTVAMLGWHLPKPYDWALRSSAWHETEHATFFVTSIVFWWPVIQAWPSRAPWPRWGMIPYLLLADFANSALCAFLIFSNRIFYPFYLQLPRIGGLSVENDQVIAGAVMWVFGSLAFLIPAVAIAVNLLSPARLKPLVQKRHHRMPLTPLRRILLSTLICVLPLAALAYGYGSSDSVDIDGDVPLAHAASRGLLVTVFAEPQPLSIGSHDLVVLAQDASGQPISDASINICATRDDESARHVQGQLRPAANKLLKAATIELPKPGTWDIRTRVKSGGKEFVLHSTVEVKSMVSQR